MALTSSSSDEVVIRIGRDLSVRDGRRVILVIMVQPHVPSLVSVIESSLHPFLHRSWSVECRASDHTPYLCGLALQQESRRERTRRTAYVLADHRVGDGAPVARDNSIRTDSSTHPSVWMALSTVILFNREYKRPSDL